MITVQQMIDQLQRIQDKSQELKFQIHSDDGDCVVFGEFYSISTDTDVRVNLLEWHDFDPDC